MNQQESQQEYQQEYQQLVVTEAEMREVSAETTGLFYLPPELRLQIWSLALPRERVLRMAFHAHCDVGERTVAMGTRNIPTILHICHESRKYGKSVLRQGFGEPSTLGNKHWWNPNKDILYLPSWQPPPTWDLRVSFNFRDFEENFPYPPLDVHRDDSNIGSPAHHTSLSSVQHLALPFNYKVLNGIKFSDKSESWLPPWLHGFRALKSVKLLIDHVPQWYRAGDIQLYLPLDVPLNGPPLPTASLTFNTPSKIATKIMQKLEEYRKDFYPDWTVPRVEIIVMGNTEKKEHCGFCLPARSA